MAEIRQINLKKLEVKYGSQVALAEILDTSTARVNHLLTGQRNIGEKTARKFEVLLGQPSGWMDTLDSINPQQASPLLDKFNQLCPDQQKEVTEFINFKLSQNKENKPLTARPENVGGGGVNLPDPLFEYIKRQNSKEGDAKYLAHLKKNCMNNTCFCETKCEYHIKIENDDIDMSFGAMMRRHND